MQLKIGYLFQCPPWARSFWAFSPFLTILKRFQSFLCLSVKSGEERVKRYKKLFTPRNADKHRGFGPKGEE